LVSTISRCGCVVVRSGDNQVAAAAALPTVAAEPELATATIKV